MTKLEWVATITPLGESPEDAALLVIQAPRVVGGHIYDTMALARRALIDMEERSYAAWQENAGADPDGTGEAEAE